MNPFEVVFSPLVCGSSLASKKAPSSGEGGSRNHARGTCHTQPNRPHFEVDNAIAYRGIGWLGQNELNCDEKNDLTQIFTAKWQIVSLPTYQGGSK